MIRATTETGSVYELNDGFVRIKSLGSPQLWDTTIHIMDSKVAAETNSLSVPWLYDDDDSPWEYSPVPVIGKRWYVSGMDEWRISTTIVSVEEVDE